MSAQHKGGKSPAVPQPEPGPERQHPSLLGAHREDGVGVEGTRAGGVRGGRLGLWKALP